VFYEVASVTANNIGLTAPYTGVSTTIGASKEVAAPVVLAAVYSTSDLDDVNGPGAQSVEILYDDSAGNSAGVAVNMSGKFPAVVVLDPTTIDIAQVEEFVVLGVG